MATYSGGFTGQHVMRQLSIRRARHKSAAITRTRTHTDTDDFKS